jgi:pimeloyl-ACP methyl ester carboxylesterase
MRVLNDFAINGERARSLAILLPGALQQPEDFVRSGFVEAVRKRNLSLDLWLVDPGLQFIGEAANGLAQQRIHESVIQPALLAKYQEIWLVGISIGGFMAIDYADQHPGLIGGLCLLAPYPGNRIITGEIMAAGGLAQWLPDSIEDGDAERRVWRWLKTHREHAASVRIHLGYGLEDRFAPGHRLMAEVLAPDCVDTAAGGHDWPVWRQLWENFLDRRASRFTRSLG